MAGTATPERVSSCIGPTWHDVADTIDPNPSAPVPFEDDPKAAPALDFDHGQPDLTAKDAARLLAMVDKNGKPTDAFYGVLPGIGYQVGGRGDWRVRRADLDKLRGVAA